MGNLLAFANLIGRSRGRAFANLRATRDLAFANLPCRRRRARQSRYTGCRRASHSARGASRSGALPAAARALLIRDALRAPGGGAGGGGEDESVVGSGTETRSEKIARTRTEH